MYETRKINKYSKPGKILVPTTTKQTNRQNTFKKKMKHTHLHLHILLNTHRILTANRGRQKLTKTPEYFQQIWTVIMAVSPKKKAVSTSIF